MNPVTHLFIGWLVANSAELERHERTMVTLAGVIPDVDGLVVIADFLIDGPGQPPRLYATYHHVILLNIGFGLIIALAGLFLARKHRLMTSLLIWTGFHVHLLCDIIGARGDDGFQWPVPYLLPFSDSWQLTWNGQWVLNSWPNMVITGLAVSLTFYLAWKRGFSPLSMVSTKADAAFVGALRKRFGSPMPAERGPTLAVSSEGLH